MIVVMERGASEREIELVVAALRQRNLTPHLSTGVERTVIGVLGPVGPTGVAGALGGITPELGESLAGMEGVEQVLEVTKPYKLASRDFHPEPTVIRVESPGGEVLIGGREVVMMAGPCTVESEEQLLEAARTSHPPRRTASAGWASPGWSCWRRRGRRRGWRW